MKAVCPRLTQKRIDYYIRVFENSTKKSIFDLYAKPSDAKVKSAMRIEYSYNELLEEPDIRYLSKNDYMYVMAAKGKEKISGKEVLVVDTRESRFMIYFEED